MASGDDDDHIVRVASSAHQPGVAPVAIDAEKKTLSKSDSYDVRNEDHFGEVTVVTDAKQLVTRVLHVDDDPTLSPYTFRAFFLGEP